MIDMKLKPGEPAMSRKFSRIQDIFAKGILVKAKNHDFTDTECLG
jgi:hypothetical protein